MLRLILILAVITLTNALTTDGGSLKACVNPKHIALTFDDGPGEFTSEVLNVLNEVGVKATFFQLGVNVESNPEQTKAIFDAGHLLASHSYSHVNYNEASEETIRSDMNTADNVFKSAIGRVPVFFRYPYGEWNANTDKIVVGELGRIPISWNVDTQDWRYANTEPSRIFGDFPGQVAAYAQGKGVINIQHSEAHAPSVDAIRQIVDWGNANGYSFVTVAECIGYTEGPLYVEENSTGRRVCRRRRRL